jgi:phosphate transport system ATP-binding protein
LNAELVTTPNLSPPVLSAHAVGVSYHGRKVLDGVNLKFGAGKITALVGPSGCGKTSFLNVFNRMTDLITGCKVEGQVRWGDLDIRSPQTNARLVRREIGMIFQKPNPFPLSIQKNLELPLKERGVHSRQERAALVESVLESVGLWRELKDRLATPALELSGGQQQRLCLARALTMEPKVLLMDEPCSALDPMSCEVVENLITSLRKRLTIVIVTHNLFQARRIADDLAMFWVRDGIGQLIENGTCAQLVTQPDNPITSAYVSGLRG